MNASRGRKPATKRMGRPPIPGIVADLHVHITEKQNRWLNQKAHNSRRAKTAVLRSLLDDAMARDPLPAPALSVSSADTGRTADDTAE